MSVLSVAPYFPFAGVLPVRQSVQQVGTSTHSLITFATNQATRPACSGCGQRVEPIHSYHVRRVRDLSLAQARVDLDIPHRKVRCPDCGIRIEAHVFLDPFRTSSGWVRTGARRPSSASFGDLSDDQLASIEAFALDMSGAYRHALQQMCSHAALVYDCFHVVARYGREVIDRVRLDESKKQSGGRTSLHQGQPLPPAP